MIKSLQLKKYRKQEQLFLIEGAKNVLESIDSDISITTVLATTWFLNEYDLSGKGEFELITVDENLLGAIGSLKTNNAALAVGGIRENLPLYPDPGEFVLLLDDIRDPGNLGAIIRVADWYGIKKIICSQECADFYNPKVIMAGMGSFTRVRAFYTNLEEYIAKADRLVYGALLEGENIHTLSFESSGMILMGNESKGISKALLPFIDHKITIPRFGGAESLNVATATAVICDNLRRPQITKQS